jgi:large subunit ribosomal protein L11
MPQIKLLVEGGQMAPTPALSQKLGPLGINVGQVISKVNSATNDFKGLKVPVELSIDAKTKSFDVKVFSPPTSELIKKELGLQKGSGEQKKVQIGNISIEQAIYVAKTKMQNLLCKDLKAAVKSVVGTCVSLGILVESKLASEVGKDIDEGKYDKEIKSGKTETSPEKRKELDSFFQDLNNKQLQAKKVEDAAQAAKEAEAPAAAKAPVATPAAKAPAAKKK